MKITKNSSEIFDYLKTIKQINKMQGSPKNLSKEKIFNKKDKNLDIKINDPIFNENIPIKVRLIKAAHLNPNINFTKMKNINKKKNEIKEKDNDTNEQKGKNIISVKKNNFGKIKIIPPSNKSHKTKKENNINKDSISNNDNNNSLNVFKYNYIKNKIISKEKEEENLENVDFETKTYDTNIAKSNYINKKTKSKFDTSKSKIEENEEENYNNQILNTEGGGMKRGKGIFSSDNIFSNCNNNYYVDKSTLKNNTENKLYNLNTFVAANNENNMKEKINSPISVQTYNNTNSYNITNNNYKYIYLSPKNEKILTKRDSNNENAEIKLDDLILFEEKLNDIYIALNTKNVYEEGASNECAEFISFYFNSSLKNKFTYFFNGMNKVIIKSATNLILYTIIVSYHLSLNLSFLNKLSRKLKKIFLKLKLNLYLFIKKIQLFYGEKFTKKNDVYFRNFNYILIQEKIFNCDESKIVKLVNKNCYDIVYYLDKILDFYKSVENNYYQDFSDIFSSISKLDEVDIRNYFYSHLFINSSFGKPKPKSNNKKTKGQNSNYNVNTESNENTLNMPVLPITKISNDLLDINSIVDNDIKIFSKNKNKDQENSIISNYEKNKVNPPFLKNKNKKKYTLVLDLEETLVHINQEGEIILRPGLYKFLKEIKPYYELVSFSNESKYSSEPIINIIEEKKKYFDYNLYREHLTFSGKDFIKDLSKLGRDIKKVIIVDNIANNFKLNSENGIQISPFFGEDEEDNTLNELKKILISFANDEYEDLRTGIKKYKKVIRSKITKKNNNK